MDKVWLIVETWDDGDSVSKTVRSIFKTKEEALRALNKLYLQKRAEFKRIYADTNAYYRPECVKKGNKVIADNIFVSTYEVKGVHYGETIKWWGWD